MATPKNRSVQKAFHILKAFKDPNEWLTSREVSRRAGLPEASGYRLIQTLEEIGAVVRGTRGRYRPGMLLVSLSNNVAMDDLLREASHAIIGQLAETLDVTVHLGLLEGGMVTYIAKVSTPTSIVTHTKPGSQLEAYCSGLGKVLLAALPADELENFILEGDLVALTPFTITDRTALLQQLEMVRRTRFAMDDREIRVDMRCLAVPVRDGNGRTIAAMSATDHADRMTEDRQRLVCEALFEAAAELEHKLIPASLPSIARERRGSAARAFSH